MPEAQELARRLVEYDQRLAEDLLEMICSQLGGPAADGSAAVHEMQSFLSDPEVARSRSLSRLEGDVAESPSTTSEWKAEFSHSERLRGLGLAIAERLGPKIPR